MPIKKAIFVVAGYGTRFLPATKAQPKEMLPIVNKPIIQYLVEEAVEAGIQEIIFVTGRGKDSIENHFDKSFELEKALEDKGKFELRKEVENISKLANFAYVRQPIQRGDGDALLCARPFIDPTESVLVIFPDYLMPKENKSMQRMVEMYRDLREPVICCDEIDTKLTSQYGVIDYEETESQEVLRVKSFVEKPIKNPPSNLIAAGYYIITPEIMNILNEAESTTEDGEIRVADALFKLTEMKKPLYALKPKNPGFDCGSVLGFLKATVSMGLKEAECGEDFMDYLKDVVKDK